MFKVPNHVKSVIVGISSTTLTNDEISLFKEYPPLGFILFKRNCKNVDQVKSLVSELKTIVGYECPILIDQEGGRVSRLKEPFFKEFKAPQTFLTEDEVYQNAYLMARELKDLGINVNCTPLVDLVFGETHEIIGDRSFGSDPDYVGKMAAAVVKGHFDAGIMPVIKHLPGHGRANTDSHETLPIVRESLKVLQDTDFKAFKVALEALKEYPTPWGMTAHILYTEIDSEQCATQSSTIIQDIIRLYIGFNGFLLSDCVTMKALKGTYSERVQKSLAAGCNAALHCSGDFEEMKEILKNFL